MVAYNFKRQFTDPIIAGTKRQTIRADRRRHARGGGRLQLYTGMRTKYCQLIGTAWCLSASPITIDFTAEYIVYLLGQGRVRVYRGGLDSFAKGDGFDDWAAMRAFWETTHSGRDVFNGWIIRWTEFSIPRG